MNRSFKTKTIDQSQIEEKWYQVDATGMRPGLLATRVAEMLLDKGNPKMRDYLTPQVHVIVINSGKLDISEKKGFNKLYTQYSGYPGGLKTNTLGELFEARPNKVVELSIRRMLPKNRRGRAIFSNLRVFEGTEHNHEAQKPIEVNLNEIKF